MPINKSMLFGSGRSNSGWFRVVPPVRVLLAATLIQGTLIQGTMVGAAHAQDASSRADLAPDEVNNAANQAADRFFDVLKRRPRRGIALDRVYGYHVQNRSLDSFLESLENDSSGNDAQRGTRMFILGLMQTQRGKAAAAENALSVAEELLPDEAMVCFERGRALLAIGETERAADAFERAIDRGPARNEALPIYTELGQLYARVGDREKSLRVWKRLEQQIPGDQRIQTQIAATLAREGQYDEALRRYTELAKTARKEDDQIAAAIGAAEMRRKLDQPDQAVADLEAILARLRPGSWLYRDVRNRIEDGFIRGGDYDGLAKYYQAKLDAAPDDLSLRTRLGGILMRAGRLQDAIGMLREAVERAPDDADVRLSLIEVLEKTGDREAAAKQYEALTQRDAGNPDYLLRWGELVASDPKVDPEQRAERAVAIWKRLADARNDDAVVLSQIADRYRSVKRDEDAIALYRRAIEIDPTSPQYREYLGEYLLQLDRKPEAIEVWKSIAAGDRRDRDALVRLAEVFTTFKLRDEAIAAWDDAASTDLDFGQRLRYASVLSDNESYERALETLEEAAELAETPEDREQLLTQRIKTYKDSGTLDQRIAQVAKDATSAGDFRELAMMHSAGGQMTDAATAIDRAIQLAPEDTSVLLASAEISERQTLWSKAAERFESLAKLDPRYRSNYLQKVANLQVRMGQSDAAIQTAQRIIESNPAAPDSYQTFARIAMRAGKDDEAFAALRRAMNVAPRDNSPRRMLASSLAERYRTDEAIELYWQAMRLERDDDAKMELVARLAPLYERKNAIPELIGRIENEERRDEDPRTTQLMIATANETIQDYGAARSIVDKLLAAQPRDPELLKRMVDLSDRAYEIVSAAEYQKRLLKLADTPENRSRLMMLELDAGIIDIETALRRRIAAGVDASRLGSMIRAAAARRDLDSAIAICRATLDDHPDYWDVKLSLAQILVAKISSSDESKNAGVVTESEQLCDSLLSDDRPLDELPPTRRKTNSPATAAYPPGYTPPDRTSPFYWSSSRYTLARNYGLGNYGRSYGSSANFQLVTPYSFGHCRIIAASLKVAGGLKQQPASVLEEFDPVAEAEKVFPIADLDKVDTPETILSQKSLRDTLSYFRKPRQIRRGNRISYSYASDDDDAAEKRVEQIAWKLAELDPLRHTNDLMTLLAERTPRVLAAIDPDKDAKNDSKKPAEDAKAGSDKSDSEDDEATEELIPLSPARLQALATVVDTQIKNFAESRQKNPKTSPQTVLVWKRLLSTEAELAGDAEMASRYAIEDPDVQREDFNGLYSYMLNFVMLKQYERAEKYLPALLAAARQPGASSSQLSNGLAAGFGPIATAEPFWQKHRFELLDIGLALANTQAVTAQNKRAGRRSSTNNTGGSVRVRVRVPGEGNDTRVTSKMLIGPLSETLANAGDLQQVVAAIPFDKTQDNQSYSSAPQRQTVPKEVIEHLRKIPAEASADERLRREIVTAFAMWWNDGPEAAFPVIERLAQSHPDNLELQIEKARLAYELKRPRQALEALDAIRPLDSRMLVQKEMAAMQLASQLGDSDRAKVAAKRLFGMRLDTQTQLSLAQKLQALDMVDEAKAVLQRTRGGRAKDESTLLAIARQFERSGDKQSAAEVAYSLLKRLDSGRTTSNVDYYRRSAINLLKQAKKLQPLIAQARARVASTPKSVRAKTDLADLLESAGQTKAAQKVWEEIGKQQPTNPRQLLAKAKSLGKAKKQVEACELYLQAFEKDASLIRREFYNFYNTARAAKKKGPILEALAKFPMDRFPDYRVNELMSLTEGVSSKAANDFIAKVLKNPATRDNALASLSQRKDWLESDGARDAVAEALCSQSAYQSNSPLWSVRSYGGEGVINGTLPTFVDAIRTNEDLGKRFESFVKTVRDDKDSAIIGDVELVGALVMLPAAKSTYKEPNAASADDAIGKLKQVYAPELARVDTYGEATEESDDDDNNSVTLSPFVQSNNGLAWQAAQYIKNHPATGENKELVIAAYMKATDGNPATNSFGYSPTRGLVDAYVDAGKVDIARGLLWRRLRDADYDDNNRFNPGYGDYQRISELQAVAGMLGEMKCLLDALVVYETLLGDRESFKSAARWGGSQSLEKQVQTQRDRFRKLLKDEDSIEFLEFLTSAKVISVADLCGGSFQSEMAPDGPLTLALESCVKTEAGRKAIDNLDADLAQRIDEAAEKVDEKTDSNMAIGSRDLRLTRLLIQLIRIADPDNRDADSIARAAEFADQLQPMLDRLGKLEAIDPPDVQAVGRLVGLAQRMRKIDASEIQAIADAWATGLESPVALSEDIDLDLQWRSLQGEAEDSFTTLIDEVIAMDVGAKSKTRSMKLLKLARLAADAGRLDASTRALREAFKEGPPVQAVEQGGADPFGSGSNPFGVRASASMSMGGMGMVGESETEASITTQLGELMNVYSDQLNVQIGARKPKPKSKSKETLDQDTKRQSIKAIHAALAAIMMPDAAPQKWFDYGEPESGNQYRDPFGNAGDAGDDSLVPVLARTAKLSGQTEDVIAKLGERFDNNPSALQIGFAILEIAEVGGNKTLFEEWFEPVEVLVSTELPPLDAPAVEATRVQSITTQMQQQTAKKSRLVESMIARFLPIVQTRPEDAAETPEDANTSDTKVPDEIDYSPNVREKAKKLLLRTRKLIRSDTWTLQRLSEADKMLSSVLIEDYRQRGRFAKIRELLGEQVSGLEQQYSQYYPNDLATQRQQVGQATIGVLAMHSVDDATFTELLPLYRKGLKRLSAQDTFPASQPMDWVAKRIGGLKPESQYETLKRLTFGDDEEPSKEVGDDAEGTADAEGTGDAGTRGDADAVGDTSETDAYEDDADEGDVDEDDGLLGLLHFRPVARFVPKAQTLRDLYGDDPVLKMRDGSTDDFVHPNVPVYDSIVALHRAARLCGKADELRQTWAALEDQTLREYAELIDAILGADDGGEVPPALIAKLQSRVDRLRRERPEEPKRKSDDKEQNAAAEGSGEQDDGDDADDDAEDDDEVDKPVLPMNDLVIAALMLDKGWNGDLTDSLITELRAYATRLEDNTGITLVGRLMAESASGRHAGSNPGSPLKHFMAMPQTAYQSYYGFNQNLQPLYRVDSEGVLHTASGQGRCVLMLKYPVEGDFEFVADTVEGNAAEANLTAGGLRLIARGWDRTATIGTLVGAANKFEVPEIRYDDVNQKSVRVTGSKLTAACNDAVYFEDIYDTSFPFVGLTHRSIRFGEIRGMKIEGNPTIPRSVNLISPTMRGWITTGNPPFIDPKIPEGNIQEETTAVRRNIETAWSLSDEGVLEFAGAASGSYDGGTRAAYSRPLLDGEAIRIEFWHDEGVTSLGASLDRMQVIPGDEGWIPGSLNYNVMAQTTLTRGRRKPAKPKVLASDIRLKDQAWNVYEFRREGADLVLRVNGDELVRESCTLDPHVGWTRANGQLAKIRKMELTGDWPETLPEDIRAVAD